MIHDEWKPNVEFEMLMNCVVSENLKLSRAPIKLHQPIRPGDMFSANVDDSLCFILSIDEVHLNDRFAVVTCICADGRLIQTTLDSLSIALEMTKITHAKDT